MQVIEKYVKKIEECIDDKYNSEWYKKICQSLRVILKYPKFIIATPIIIMILLLFANKLYNTKPLVKKIIDAHIPDYLKDDNKTNIKKEKSNNVDSHNKEIISLSGKIKNKKENQIYYLFREDDLDINTVSDENGSFEFENILGKHEESERIFITCCEDKNQQKCRKPSTECLIGESCDIY